MKLGTTRQLLVGKGVIMSIRGSVITGRLLVLTILEVGVTVIGQVIHVNYFQALDTQCKKLSAHLVVPTVQLRTNKRVICSAI